MSRRVSPSTDRVYGLQRVTRIWGVSRATVYRHRHQPEAIERRRPGPLGAMADEELVQAIRRLLTAAPVSRRRLPQALGTAALPGHPHQPAPGPAADAGARPAGPPARWPAARLAAHDGTIVTERVDVMWGTDMTSK